MDPEIEQAAVTAGIATDYIDAQGQRQIIARETLSKLLAAMNTQALCPESGPLPVVKLFSLGEPLVFPLMETTGNGEYQWLLRSEQGSQQQGSVCAPGPLMLPALPLGYHQLTLSQATQQWHCRVVVTPKRCYEPEALLGGKKLWGACVQLYTLRSEHNWGMGDFGDLRALLAEIGQRGGAFVGLNPIHALYPANPENASPYSPSSRCWLNVLYIDLNAVEDFHLSAAAQQWWQQMSTQQLLLKVRDSDWVDYSSVTQLKLPALKLAFSQFCTRHQDDELRLAFDQFVTEGGNSLYQQAVFDALQMHLAINNPDLPGWRAWPAEYQQANGPAVALFCQQYAEEIIFYQWLQWVAASQFAACFAQSCEQQMPIGLYRDLAVGVAEGSAETWFDAELYCLQASVGAPPDSLGPLGQNWNLPPMDPHVMVARAYQPFIDLLRANMRHCGALRIDHVMALLRLWWIPAGETAEQGAYVRYPIDDLLALLALESQRHRCMVIGEDLGIVPEEIVTKLRDSGVYSYNVLYFEHDERQQFHPPSAYPWQAMATITTHDLPTLHSYWQHEDLTLGEQLGLYPDAAVLNTLLMERQRAKQGLLDVLHNYHCVPQDMGREAELLGMSLLLNHSLHYYLAESASALLGLQPEDWLDMVTPVNIPGTRDQYPNWRRKLSKTLEVMFADQQIEDLLQEVNRRRQR